jgi:hypothetical protein
MHAAQSRPVTARAYRDPETLERLLAQREAELLEAWLLIEKVKLQILRAKPDKFGASSERLKELAQIKLLVEELETERERIVPALQDVAAKAGDALALTNDGRIEIDISAAERALRGVALEHNNYLSMGLDAGDERATAMYSLIGTAKLNGLDLQAYLRHVFERIAEPSLAA